LVFLILLSTFLTHTQSIAQITFEKIYGGSGSDEAYSVQQTTDDGYIVAGRTNAFGAGDYDVYLIRTDAWGDTLWTKTFGGPAYDEGYSVQQTTDGGFIVAGSTTSFGSGDYDFYLIKTDSVGDTLWTRTYGDDSIDYGFSVQQTNDGGFIIGGWSLNGLSGYDFHLVRTDSSGETLWTRFYGDIITEDFGYSVKQTSDGGFIFTGWLYNVDPYFPAVIYMIKTDSTGATQFTGGYGGLGWDESYSVQQTSDEGYVIAGFTSSFGSGGYDVYLIKTNSSGDTLWTQTFGGTSGDEGRSVQQTSDEGYIISGSTGSFGVGSSDVYLIKTDSLGNILWTRTYGGIASDIGYSVQQTTDGGYIIGGKYRNDVYLIKTDGDGMVVGIEEDDEVLQIQNVKLYQNLPNPFNKLTAIGYQLRDPSYTTLKVYDITGRLVKILVDKKQNPGVYRIEWEGKNLTSGIYFYRLKAGEFTRTRKMIFLK
jgi:hypothetical protein